MRKNIIIRLNGVLIALMVLLSIVNSQLSIAQSDTTIHRIVTVERDFQPAIQSAGKINQRPAIITPDIQLNPVVYSTYSTPLSIDYNINQLPAAKTNLTHPSPLDGILEGAAGYRNTHFLFGYQIHQKKKMSLNLYAKHDAYWGKDALSQSTLGMQVARHFSGADLYFTIEGNNDAYVYQPNWSEWQTLWNANTKIGIRSTNKAPIQYRIQTGYSIFTTLDWTLEHSVKSHLDLWWTNQQHSAGIKAYVQNTFYTTFDDSLTITPRHNIRVEPFYEYKNDHIRLHAGVNLNMNIGTGNLLSGIDNLSFAPSPNVQFEWSMVDNIFHVYANATGQFGLGSWEEYMTYNRYLNPTTGLLWNSPRAYTPVDAQVGFKIRPAKTLLIDLYGGYAYMMNACNMAAHTNAEKQANAYTLWMSNIQRWKVGANLHYHYRDILEINLGGNYYFYHQEPSATQDKLYYQEANSYDASADWTTTIFDRPNWDAYAHLEAHIDTKWSIYSENYFAGSRQAYITPYLSTELRPIICLNIGGQYAINRWLSVYLQVNDYLNRKHEIFYGYHSQGIHFLAGVKWKF